MSHPTCRTACRRSSISPAAAPADPAKVWPRSFTCPVDSSMRRWPNLTVSLSCRARAVRAGRYSNSCRSELATLVSPTVHPRATVAPAGRSRAVRTTTRGAGYAFVSSMFTGHRARCRERSRPVISTSAHHRFDSVAFKERVEDRVSWSLLAKEGRLCSHFKSRAHVAEGKARLPWRNRAELD